MSRSDVQTVYARSDHARTPTVWPPGIETRLGTVPDKALAADLGIHAETVRRYRAKLGIKAYRPEVQWSVRMDACALRPMPAADIARVLGVSVTAVTVRRCILRKRLIRICRSIHRD